MQENDICAIGDTLDLFNRKWILCILSDLFHGAKHFNEFKQANPLISNQVLSQTLKYMIENELINKTQNNNKTEYSLTKKGFKANRILYELACYSLDELSYSTLDMDEKNKIKEEFKKNLRLNE